MASTIMEVSSTKLARHFSDYLAQVRYGGKTLVIEKNRRPVAEMKPLPGEGCNLKEFLDLWLSGLDDDDFASDLETVNNADQPPENPWE